MTTFVISHRSTLVSYLVATALRLYYRQRTIRIVIVEIFDRNLKDIRPWCGVSTVSNPRMLHHGFLCEAIVAEVLGQHLGFMDSIQIRDSAQRFAPELPAQGLRISAHPGTPRQYLALLYHPAVVAGVLRGFLAGANVSFTSVLSESAILDVVRHLGPVCWINFARGDLDNRHMDVDMLVHSQLTAVEYSANSRTKYSGPLSLLWLPRFRADTKMFSEAIFTSELRSLGKSSVLTVHAINLNIYENDFSLRHDLLHGLKASDYVLQMVDQMVVSQNLDVIPHRL